MKTCTTKQSIFTYENERVPCVCVHSHHKVIHKNLSILLEGQRVSDLDLQQSASCVTSYKIG